MVDIIEKINTQGNNKILFMIYEDKIKLTLNYSNKTNEEEILKLYTFLKFYLKQLEKELDLSFEEMYFATEEENGRNHN